MLRKIRSQIGQIQAGEYAILFAIVAVSFVMMTVFIKRAIQARIHNTRNMAIELAKKESAGYYTGNFIYEYEPYYKKTKSDTEYYSRTDVDLSGEATSVREGKRIKNDQISETLPPLFMNETEPEYY